MCVCVCLPQAIKNQSHEMKPELIKQVTALLHLLSILQMGVALVMKHVAKEEQGNAVFAIPFTVKDV